MPFCYCEEANYDNSDELQKFALVLTRFSSLKSFSIEFDNEYGRDEISAVVSGDIIEALSSCDAPPKVTNFTRISENTFTFTNLR